MNKDVIVTVCTALLVLINQIETADLMNCQSTIDKTAYFTQKPTACISSCMMMPTWLHPYPLIKLKNNLLLSIISKNWNWFIHTSDVCCSPPLRPTRLQHLHENSVNIEYFHLQNLKFTRWRIWCSSNLGDDENAVRSANRSCFETREWPLQSWSAPLCLQFNCSFYKNLLLKQFLFLTERRRNNVRYNSRWPQKLRIHNSIMQLAEIDENWSIWIISSRLIIQVPLVFSFFQPNRSRLEVKRRQCHPRRYRRFVRRHCRVKSFQKLRWDKKNSFSNIYFR